MEYNKNILYVCMVIKFNTMEKSSDLRWSTSREKNGYTFVIDIRLNDECNNGHEDFSITGKYWSPGDRKTNNNACFGAIGDTVVEHLPSFGIFNDLHLCDFNGAPMYSLGNGYYHLVNNGPESCQKYLRLNEVEIDVLKNSADEQHFTYLFNKFKVHERWKVEAEGAIEFLEKVTGKKFESKATKSHFTPMSDEEMDDFFNTKIKTGYYNPENIEKRRVEAEQKKKQELIDKIKTDAQKKIDNINGEMNLKLEILDKGGSVYNLIYYTHTNEAVFNWSRTNPFVTPSEYAELMDKIDYSNLPEGITFKLKEY